ncbi:hypothetical protein GF402_03365 [Candidatus Fermentibacteria bacterium]|nr:hypothetical protein [Candidatus Fermentibacteria bacterium]
MLSTRSPSGTASGCISLFLGILATVGGIAILLFLVINRQSVRSGTRSIASGISSARSAITAISEGVGSSSDLVSSVRTSLQSTAKVIDGTERTLAQTGATMRRLRELAGTASEDLGRLQGRLGPLAGRESFESTIEMLRRTEETSGVLLFQLDSLRQSLQLLKTDVTGVAASVGTLEADLFSTEAAFGDACEHLRSAESAANSAVRYDVLFLLGIVLGAVVTLAGLDLLLLGRAMSKRKS